MRNNDIYFYIILIFIIIYIIINNIQKSSCYEKFTTPDVDTLAAINTAVAKAVKSSYDYDVEAMRNLGAISKSLLTGTNYHNPNIIDPKQGELTIPANNTILEGTLQVNSSITSTGNINSSGNITSSGSITSSGNITNTGNITSNGTITSTGLILGSSTSKSRPTIDNMGNILNMNNILLNGTIYSRKQHMMYYSEEAIIYDDMTTLIAMNTIVYPNNTPNSSSAYYFYNGTGGWNGRTIYGQGNSFNDMTSKNGIGLIIVVPKGKSVVWLRTLKDRCSSFSLYTIKSSGSNIVQDTLIGSYVNGIRNLTLYSPDGANGGGTGNYQSFSWMPIPVPVNDTMDVKYILCNGMPQSDMWRDGWIGGIAFSTNPWNHAMNCIIAYRDDIKANGTRVGVDNTTWVWNSDENGLLSMGRDVDLMVPCINSGKDKLLYYVEHNSNWAGGISSKVQVAKSNIDFWNPIENFRTTYSNPFATSINSKMYNRFYAARIPANLITHTGVGFIRVNISTLGLTGDAINLRELGTMDLY